MTAHAGDGVAVPPLGPLTKLAYGFGSVANGVKDHGFNYFLLFFYSQVIGLNAALVGLIILAVLLCDAFSDPIVGYWSDNVHSKWGRRHPFLYASVVPLVVTYALIWMPPLDQPDWVIAIYLFVTAVAIRTLITLFEVPASALVPELTDDYNVRTTLLSLRYFFGWAGGLTVAIKTYAVFLQPTETVSEGLFNIEGYQKYGFLAAGIIGAGVLVSALGTHHRIPYLKAPPPKEEKTLGRIFGEIFETLADRSFFALFAAALFGSVATGLGAGMSNYLNGFFWGFTTDQIALLNTSLFLSAALALILSPIVSRLIGKKKGVLLIGFLGFSLAPLPVVLRLFDLLPENGTQDLFVFILTFNVVDIALIIATQTLLASMIADLVEESERRTHRRSEGVFFAAISFTRKCTLGLGAVAVSIMLAVAQFPAGAKAGEVDTQTILNLGAVYAPTVFVVWMSLLVCILFYRIDEKRHVENLEALAEREKERAAQASPAE